MPNLFEHCRGAKEENRRLHCAASEAGAVHRAGDCGLGTGCGDYASPCRHEQRPPADLDGLSGDYAMLKMFVDKYYSFFEKIMKLLMDNDDFLYV